MPYSSWDLFAGATVRSGQNLLLAFSPSMEIHLFDMIQAFLFGFEFIISNATDLSMRNGAAQCFSIYIFPDRRFYQVGTGK